MQVNPILVDQAEFAQTFCKLRTADLNLSVDLGLEPQYRGSEIAFDKRGVGTDRF